MILINCFQNIIVQHPLMLLFVMFFLLFLVGFALVHIVLSTKKVMVFILTFLFKLNMDQLLTDAIFIITVVVGKYRQLMDFGIEEVRTNSSSGSSSSSSSVSMVDEEELLLL